MGTSRKLTPQIHNMIEDHNPTEDSSLRSNTHMLTKKRSSSGSYGKCVDYVNGGH